MARRVAASRSMVLIGMALAAVPCAVGQRSVPTQGPRFLLAAWTPEHASDASSAPVLQTKVTLELGNATIDQALKEIIRQTDLEISYSSRIVPLERRVSVHGRGITVAAALAEVLSGLPVDVSLTEAGGLALVRGPGAAPAPADSGAVAGQVTDSATGAPIVGATVIVEGTRPSAVTDAGGRYRIGGLAVGSYVVRARYIGYRPLAVPVVISTEQEATLNFSLVRAAQPLEQLVVTGTIVPTEAKAIPTPVSVIEASDIEGQRPHTVQELFRQAVPTAVSWDFANSPYTTSYSVRGASTLGGGAQMKVLIDGLEVVNPGRAPVDPSSIQRIEVIRGPQAAAIYGSEAIGGVIQIFTKRGGSGLTRPILNAEAALGRVETPYAGFDGVLRQAYTASAHGGGSNMTYNVGAGYSHINDYLPDGELSKQSNPSIYGGLRYNGHIVDVDVGGRYFSWKAPIVLNPELRETGFVPFSKPDYQDSYVQNQSLVARVSVAPKSWWRNTVTLGLDRYITDVEQAQPRFTTPTDTLLQVFTETRTKMSVGFNASIEGRLAAGVSGSLIAGVDHWGLPIYQFFTAGALNTTGRIQPGPGQSVSASRTKTNNTGYFAQGQLGLWEVLFLTAGLRVERNSDFGDSLGTPVSPRVGLSYAQSVGRAVLKARGSYGQALRAPTPGLRLAAVTPTTVTLANPGLGPERQKGWDAGMELVFPSRSSLSVTYYDQTAEDLIQFVQVQADPVLTFQNQNVGRVRNTGVEIEGAIYAGPLQIKGQYGYVRARVEQLAPNYTGDLRIGDQTLTTPRHTAGISMTGAFRTGTTVTAGLTYVGNWTNYDLLARFRCFGGTGPCRSLPRDYIYEYAGFAKVNATVWQQVTPLLSAFTSVDNITNNRAYEFGNQFPVMGRVATVGLRLSY